MERKNTQPVIISIVLVGAVLAFLFLSLTFNRPPLSPPGEPEREGHSSRRDEWPAPAPSPAPASTESSIHLALGNPSHAVAELSQPDNYLMVKPYFALSYNSSHGTPNWVSWCLKRGDFGPAPRVEFAPDLDLPRSFKQVTPRDYNGSGFDRGHMCPRGDRSSSVEAATATFTMTNVVPQSHPCNSLAWNDLEEYCRDLVGKKHQTLYIVSGPQGKGGEGTRGPTQTIAGGKVTVPAKCWKVVLVLNHGTGTASDVDKVDRNTRLIAVIMPNDQSVDHGWAKYRTSVADVETLTGYRFFECVPAEIIDPLKKEVDREAIPPPKPHRNED